MAAGDGDYLASKLVGEHGVVVVRQAFDGDAQAASIYASAFGRNPEFFAFYRSQEAYRESFAGKSDVLVVEPSSDFFRYLRSATGQPAKSTE